MTGSDPPFQQAASGSVAAEVSGESVDQALARAQGAARAHRLHEANGICLDILGRMPDQPAALALAGVLAGIAGDPERGVVLLRRAVRLQPGTASWHAHLGALCRTTHRMEEALAAGQESIRLDAGNPEHLVNLSLILVDVDERSCAIACLLRAIGLRHDHADAHLAMAQTLLAMGEFDAGWIEYEWRNRTETGKATMPVITSAYWNGMTLPGERLLLVGDQGYGDTIQFARYIPMVAERCRELIIGCSAEIGPLLTAIPGVARYCHSWTEIPAHTAHCRLSSLPYLFRTQLDTIPVQSRYLRADPARIMLWRERLALSLPPGVQRIGLAWTGRPTHPNDRRRSLALVQLHSLAGAGPAAFVSLQKLVPERDLDVMTGFPGMIDLSELLTDFGETAALMENLDLVITVDTAIGHLAGALGKPAWILLPKAADWRWLLGREDTPWYPSVRLFRQQIAGDWNRPIEKVRSALQRQLAGELVS